MKLSLLATLAAASLAATAEIKSNMAMDRLMSLKVSAREKLRAKGYFHPGKWQSRREKQSCIHGKAGEYSCDKVDLYSFLSHEDMGSVTKEGNDIWGMSTSLSSTRDVSLTSFKAGRHLAVVSSVLLDRQTEPPL